MTPELFSFSILKIAILALLAVSVGSTVTSINFEKVLNTNQSVAQMTSLNNSVYYSTINGGLYEYEPNAGVAEKVATLKLSLFSPLLAYNNVIYIGADDHTLYSYNPKNKRLAIETNISTSIMGITVLNDTIYFGSTNGTIYEFNPVTMETKNVTYVGKSIYTMTAVEHYNKIYFGANTGYVHEFDPVKGENKKLVNTPYGPVVILQINNKLYFGSGYLDNMPFHEYDIATNTATIICNSADDVMTQVFWNNELYIGLADEAGLVKYNPLKPEERCKAVTALDRRSVYSLVTLNNKLYIGTQEKQVYEYVRQTDLQELSVTTTLNIISNNSDSVILTELSLLNPDIDVSFLNALNITRTSAVIEGKENNNRYFGQVKVSFIMANSQKTVNISDIIQKGLRASYLSAGIPVREIRNINTKKLIYSNVVATKGKNETVKKTKGTCFDYYIQNTQPDVSVQKAVAGCEYSRKNSTRNEISRSFITTLKSVQGEEWSNILGVWPFEDATDICGSGNEIQSNNSLTLSPSWDLSIESLACEKTIQESISPSHITLLNPSTVHAFASMDVETHQFHINLEQIVKGKVTATLLNYLNQEVTFEATVKELMESLNKLNLLPSDISINSDDTVSLNGKMTRILERESKVNVETSFV